MSAKRRHKLDTHLVGGFLSFKTCGVKEARPTLRAPRSTGAIETKEEQTPLVVKRSRPA
jgi:hypothetical protein